MKDHARVFSAIVEEGKLIQLIVPQESSFPETIVKEFGPDSEYPLSEDEQEDFTHHREFRLPNNPAVRSFLTTLGWADPGTRGRQGSEGEETVPKNKADVERLCDEVFDSKIEPVECSWKNHVDTPGGWIFAATDALLGLWTRIDGLHLDYSFPCNIEHVAGIKATIEIMLDLCGRKFTHVLAAATEGTEDTVPMTLNVDASKLSVVMVPPEGGEPVELNAEDFLQNGPPELVEQVKRAMAKAEKSRAQAAPSEPSVVDQRVHELEKSQKDLWELLEKWSDTFDGIQERIADGMSAIEGMPVPETPEDVIKRLMALEEQFNHLGASGLAADVNALYESVKATRALTNALSAGFNAHQEALKAAGLRFNTIETDVEKLSDKSRSYGQEKDRRISELAERVRVLESNAADRPVEFDRVVPRQSYNKLSHAIQEWSTAIENLNRVERGKEPQEIREAAETRVARASVELHNLAAQLQMR